MKARSPAWIRRQWLSAPAASLPVAAVLRIQAVHDTASATRQRVRRACVPTAVPPRHRRVDLAPSCGSIPPGMALGTSRSHDTTGARDPRTTDFATRFAGTLHAGIDTNAPYHAFAPSFFTVATDPDSPLGPFSAESGSARQASITLFREVLDGAKIKADEALAADLPELMWLTYMRVILY